MRKSSIVHRNRLPEMPNIQRSFKKHSRGKDSKRINERGRVWVPYTSEGKRIGFQVTVAICKQFSIFLSS